MNWTLEFDPLVSWPVLAVSGVITAVILTLVVWHHPRASVFRILALTTLLGAIANPVIVTEERRQLDSVVAVVVDDSESQRIGDRRETTSAAVDQLASQLSEIDGLRVRTVTVSPDRSDNRGDGTEAFAALERALADVPPDQVAGAIMITDGQIHDVPASLSRLGFNAPVHGLLTGRDGERDRQVEIVETPRFGIVGETGEVSVRVLDQPGGSTERIGLVIRQDGREIARLLTSHGEVVTVPVEINHAGDIYMTAEAGELDSEITDVNNRAVATIEGIRETLRVLLVSGEPHAGERTWRNLLKSDAAVDLVHFTILRPPEKQDATPINELSLIAFPTRELFSVKIHEFDLIILDRYKRRGVLPRLYLDNIARHVEQGSAVLVASGPDYAGAGSLFNTPLSDVLPGVPTGRVIAEPFKPEVTELGHRHPVTRDLPGSRADPPAWSSWFRLVQADVTTGDVVMNGVNGDPLLVLDRVGEGRIALLLSDHAWLWARGHDGGGPHLQLLRRLSHWLMKEPDLEEEAILITLDDGTAVLERRTVSNEVAEGQLTLPSGDVVSVPWEEIEPGLWRSTIEASEAGLYQVTDGDLTALGHAGPLDSREFADLLSTEEFLSPIVAASGGSLARLVEAGAEAPRVPRVSLIASTTRYGGRGWLGLKRTDASVLEGLHGYQLFAGLSGLAMLLGLVSLMWYREGR